jgi:hypothetical protein
MNVRSGSHVQSGSRSGYRGSKTLVVAAACCACLVIGGVIAVTPCRAASIPAWLDDGISKWNANNPGIQISFVDIKDSFVWYDIPKSSEIASQRIREGVNNIVLTNGYQPLDDEELVTTGKPPVASGPSKPKKCWSRAYVLNIQAQNDTKAVDDARSGQRQRMLTSLVCEDTTTWWAAFRVAQ